MTELVDVLISEFPDIPMEEVTLFGHCSGGLIAFELARALRRERGVAPAGLFVASQPPPRTVTPPPIGDRYDLRERLRRIGGTPTAVLENDELFALVEPAIRADARLCRNYQYRADAPLETSIAIFIGTIDEHVVGPVDGWAAESTRDLTTIRIEADHLFGGDAWMRLAWAIGTRLADQTAGTDESSPRQE